IQIYEPAALIVGTRGRSLGGVQGLLSGSVSKYCLQQSPVPVIVVRPSNKREKKKQKRLADQGRERYDDVLRINDVVTGKIFDNHRSAETNKTNMEDEAAAVAEAIGLPASLKELPLRNRDSLPKKNSASSLKSSDDVRVMESPSNSKENLDEEDEERKGEQSPQQSGQATSPSQQTYEEEGDETASDTTAVPTHEQRQNSGESSSSNNCESTSGESLESTSSPEEQQSESPPTQDGLAISSPPLVHIISSSEEESLDKSPGAGESDSPSKSETEKQETANSQ
ncbi:hypothetical protein KEM55_004476, partial [Ascosphaera atra]